MFKGCKHQVNLFEVLPGLFKIIAEHPVVTIERSPLSLINIGEVDIISYVDVYAIIIYWIDNGPVPCFGFIGFAFNLPEPSVRYIDKILRYVDTY